MKEKIEIQLRINDQPVSEMVFPELTLADFLHEKRGLTGTKVSCGIGVCKACTVAARRPGQFNLERIQACVMPVAALNGYDILTVEGLASSQSLSLQQQSFLNHFSFQCGYCAPGFLMGVTLLINSKENPSNAKVWTNGLRKVWVSTFAGALAMQNTIKPSMRSSLKRQVWLSDEQLG